MVFVDMKVAMEENKEEHSSWENKRRNLCVSMYVCRVVMVGK